MFIAFRCDFFNLIEDSFIFLPFTVFLHFFFLLIYLNKPAINILAPPWLLLMRIKEILFRRPQQIDWTPGPPNAINERTINAG